MLKVSQSDTKSKQKKTTQEQLMETIKPLIRKKIKEKKYEKAN